MENSIDIPLKAKDRATIWSSNHIPGHISRKDKNSNSKNYIHPNVHSSTVYNNQDMRACSVTSVVSDSETPWTMARQAPLSMGFSRPEYWSGLPFPSPVIKWVKWWSEWSEVSQSCRLFVTPWPVTRTIMQGGLPWWLSCKESPCQFRRPGFDPCVGKIPWRRAWQPTPKFLPGKSHGQRSLMGYSLWGSQKNWTRLSD